MVEIKRKYDPDNFF
ncbi:MAG: hypothetical protein DME65_09275, partial [Verrucomicrobia bacterium]